jgi:hypothetical protein
MFNLIDACLDLAAAFAEGRLAMRMLAKREATTLIDRAGASAFDAAQQIAQLARQRDDKQATELWLEVAREIARRETINRR